MTTVPESTPTHKYVSRVRRVRVVLEVDHATELTPVALGQRVAEESRRALSGTAGSTVLLAEASEVPRG